MKDPKQMTEEERTNEVCEILAQGVIRVNATEKRDEKKPLPKKRPISKS
jgi:hypothetical protein